MPRTIASAVLVALLGSVMPAAAAEAEAPRVESAAVEASGAISLDRDVDWSLPPIHLGGPKRGNLLPALYVSLSALNAFDAYSTSRGLSSGAGEANPLMRPVVNSPAALWVVKGGVTAASITLAERLWRQNRRASAVAVMVISNGMMAAVSARNASVLRTQR